MFRPIFHASVIVVNTFTMVYDQMFMELPFPSEKYKELPLRARYAFLTYWCVLLQTMYFTMSLLNDIIGSNEAYPKVKHYIRTVKDLLFSLAFPIALFVTLCFWTLYFYRKDLVFPDYVERLVPIWANMVVHVTNSVFILTEVLFSRITYPSRLAGLAFAMIFNFSYLYCLVKTWLHTGAWIYPLFEVLDLQGKVAVFASSMLISMPLYLLGEKLCSVKQVNGYHEDLKKKH